MSLFGFGRKENKSKKKQPSLDKELNSSLEELHASIRRKPQRVNDLERKFQKEWIINFSSALRAKRIENKTPILARIQLLKKEIKEARRKNKEAEKLKKAA